LRVDVPMSNDWLVTWRGSPNVATAVTWLEMFDAIGAVAVPSEPPWPPPSTSSTTWAPCE